MPREKQNSKSGGEWNTPVGGDSAFGYKPKVVSCVDLSSQQDRLSDEVGASSDVNDTKDSGAIIFFGKCFPKNGSKI